MVPNIDPKNSNLLFFPNLYVTGSCSSNKTVVGWYGFQWDLGDFEFQDGFNHLWKTWNQENINTRAEVFPPDRQFKGWNEIKLKGRDIGFMWFFGKHLIKFGIVPSLFPKKNNSGLACLTWGNTSTRASFLLTNTMKCLIWEIIQLLFIHLKPCHAVFDVKIDHLVIDLARNNLNVACHLSSPFCCFANHHILISGSCPTGIEPFTTINIYLIWSHLLAYHPPSYWIWISRPSGLWWIIILYSL